MRVIVKFQRETRPELNRWISSFRVRGGQGPAFARTILGELVKTLERHGGPPPGAEREAGLQPPTWWWRFANDFWVRVVVRDQRPPVYRFWEGRTRRVTIIEIRRRPPESRGQPTSLPT